MQNIFNILVDLKVVRSINQPLVTQNDSVVFILEVVEDGVPFDLTDTTTVSLAHTRRDGTVVVTPGTKEGNKATFELGTNETAVAGGVIAKAQFYDGEGRVSTLSFAYTVGVDPTGADYVPSETEQTLIQVVMADAQAKIDELSAVDVVELEQQLEETQNVFRSTAGGTAGSESVINVIEGYEGNAIAPSTRGAVISGGGGIGQENVIGGITTHAVAGDTTPNVVDPTITNAHYSVLGGGYNSVANGLASVLTGFHCIIEKEATHGTISGGSIHKIIDGDYATIGGGTGHEINVVDGGAYATIAGGMTNKVTGKYGTVAGGLSNEATGERSMVLGGSINKATAYGASVSGGFNNTASGNQSTVTGGQSNVASGSGAAVFNGRNNTASGQDSLIIGGAYNEAVAQNSVVRGQYGKSSTVGQQVIGGGTFTGLKGEAQESGHVLRRQTTDATIQNLGVDGAGVVPTIANDASWSFVAEINAKSGIDMKAWRIEGMFYKLGTASAAFLGTPAVTVRGETAGASTWTVGTLAGSSTLNVRITGQVGKTINWVGTLKPVEVIG